MCVWCVCVCVCVCVCNPFQILKFYKILRYDFILYSNEKLNFIIIKLHAVSEISLLLCIFIINKSTREIYYCAG